MIQPLSPPVLYILLALADDELHGYAIMQEVADKTEGRVQLLPGSLYSTIKRMVADELIEECAGPSESDGPERRYYRTTGDGRRAAANEIDRMAAVMNFGRSKNVSPSGGRSG